MSCCSADGTQKMKLHVLPVSANSHGVLAIVKALGLEDKGLEIVDAMGKTRTEEFIAMNPCHCCPTLEFGGDKGAIWESCACMRTLCQLFEGGEKYYPKDPIMRGKIDLVCDWKNTVCLLLERAGAIYVIAVCFLHSCSPNFFSLSYPP
mmetsp:Transcript_28149/g.36313  ORF Transcript_28149/g.36313 Transcript_28149/m.36313 type:complete len:149 (-) Transcript_28149:13-459(-)